MRKAHPVLLEAITPLRSMERLRNLLTPPRVVRLTEDPWHSGTGKRATSFWFKRDTPGSMALACDPVYLAN